MFGAHAAALRIVPGGTAWQPLEVAVGDTALLENLGWSGDEGLAEPPAKAELRDLFGLPDVVRLSFRPDCVLARVDVSDQLLAAMPSQFKPFDKRGSARESLGTVWLALAFNEPAELRRRFDYESGQEALNELVIGVAAQISWTLYQSRQLNADPVSGLPGAEAFRARLRRSAAVPAAALFLISIDGYSLQRKRHGQEQAEKLLKDAARCLEAVVRRDDGLFCYREAQFALIGQVQDDHGGQLLADKLLQAFAPLADMPEYQGVSASVGYVRQASVAHLDAQAMCLAAEQALDHARMRGGQQCVMYSDALPESELSQHHLASSLLTDPERGYRNNHILWQTLALLAAETEPAIVAAEFSRLLQTHLEADSVMIVEEVAGELQLLSGASDSFSVSRQVEQQILRAFRDRKLVREEEPARGVRLAIPLIARHQLQGCLYVAAPGAFDAADVMFLSALADQVAGAVDRAKLVIHSLAIHERESEALRAKLNDLHAATESGLPLQRYPSASMQAVMDFVDRVATTDVSVLIMGESGAGKEVMARTIHRASDRADKPLVIVDCSTIAPSLIESELFGRVKGAFTGADAASEGRIAMADGGTLFLDEIGELPLDVQAKLLRFVQEKELVAVGATTTQHIDTRILCATNRDLQAEVRNGAFRADLYFRLQAIQVTVPPLRQRVEDLPALVEHFIGEFNRDFDAEVEGLTDAAWLKMRTYPWPGNVRELQNTLMRAVLMTQQGLLTADDLELNEQAVLPGSDRQSVAAIRRSVEEPAAGDPWEKLRKLLSNAIDGMLAEQAVGPIGRWLGEAVVLRAWALNDRVVVSAARLLGMPETTFRRQLGKARRNADNPLAVRSAVWQGSLDALEGALSGIMSQAEAPSALAEALERCLLELIDTAVGGDRDAGAALLGVTPPTYARRVDKLVRSEPAPPAYDYGVGR